MAAYQMQHLANLMMIFSNMLLDQDLKARQSAQELVRDGLVKTDAFFQISRISSNQVKLELLHLLQSFCNACSILELENLILKDDKLFDSMNNVV